MVVPSPGDVDVCIIT